jgi:site-specific recombinase XerD
MTPVSGGTERVDRKKVLKLVQESFGQKVEGFLANHSENLNYNELAVFLHLRHLYNDSWKSLITYSVSVSDFLNYCLRPFDQVRHLDAEDYLEMLKTSSYQANTINTRIAAIKSFYGFLLKHGYVEHNPAAGLKNLRRAKARHAERVLSHEEKDKILQYAKHHASSRNFLILLFLYATGVRVSELEEITWGDLFRDIKQRWWVLIRGKGGKERDVYLPELLVQYLMYYRQYQYNVQPYAPAPALSKLPLFCRMDNVARGLTANQIYKIVKKIGKQSIGKRISPHWLRHTHATHARLKQAPLEDIMQQLGHASYNTTLRYDQSSHLREPAGQHLEEEIETPLSE